MQCEVLSIRLANCKCIIDLLNHLPNLRALVVRWKDDQSIQWLKEHLLSTFFIVADRFDEKKVFIWI